eukprot:SAG11_NODE_41106_length_198_cov_13.353535_1_plen_35_part_10
MSFFVGDAYDMPLLQTFRTSERYCGVRDKCHSDSV